MECKMFRSVLFCCTIHSVMYVGYYSRHWTSGSVTMRVVALMPWSHLSFICSFSLRVHSQYTLNSVSGSRIQDILWIDSRNPLWKSNLHETTSADGCCQSECSHFCSVITQQYKYKMTPPWQFPLPIRDSSSEISFFSCTKAKGCKLDLLSLWAMSPAILPLVATWQW